MGIPVALPVTFLADATSASNAMRAYVGPAVTTLAVLASLACVFFLVMGGIQYMSSAANPDTSSSFADGIPGGLIDLKVDPAGNLDYLTGTGTVARISYIAPPTGSGAERGREAASSASA